MNYPILTLKNTGMHEFVKFWSKLYNDPRKEVYANRINKKQFTADDVINLFIWKNAGNLSQKKQVAVKKITAELAIINQLKKKFEPKLFEKYFGYMPAIWKIFLRHIIAPSKCPIFDQHVYRAHQYLESGKIKDISVKTNNKMKEILYLDYVTFFNKFAEKNIDKKRIDEALWQFGKFLKGDMSILFSNHGRE